MTHSTRGNQWRVYLEIDGVLLTVEVATVCQGRGAERHGVKGWDWNNPSCRLDLTRFLPENQMPQDWVSLLLELLTEVMNHYIQRRV